MMRQPVAPRSGPAVRREACAPAAGAGQAAASLAPGRPGFDHAVPHSRRGEARMHMQFRNARRTARCRVSVLTNNCFAPPRDAREGP
jgi:hypothetical protein